MALLKEFKEFASKGNILDLAVGLVLGTAFGNIVSSLVADIIMPPIGWVIKNVDFRDIRIPLQDAVIENNKVIREAVSINIGNFIQTIIQFLIIAFSIFLFIKLLTRFRKKEAEKTPPGPTREEILLTEIRDHLKEKQR